MKKLIKIKLLFIPTTIILFIVIFLIFIISIGVNIGESLKNKTFNELNANNSVINNMIYAERYRNLVTKHLFTEGYVSLERLVFYLQRTNNILDTSTLSEEKWEDAYIKNSNPELKQMIPIKTICKDIKNNNAIPKYTIKSGKNANGIYIEAIDLCNINGIDITLSNEYEELYYSANYSFPLKDHNFIVTSYLFEQRDVNVDLNKNEFINVDFHNGWDFAIGLNTEIYNICDGTFEKIVFTQNNDLPFNTTVNKTGNYLKILCDDGYLISYLHIKYDSSYKYKVGNRISKGTLIARVSTTGISTGYHLHLGMQDSSGNYLDVMQYINLLE